MIIETFALSKSFNSTKALQEISLKIQEGEIFGLVGPDGAGKTTFFRTVLGLYTPTSGSFQILGTKTPERIKEFIGYVPQQFSLNSDMTVWENLTLFGSLYGISGPIFEQRAQELLEMVWMENFKDRLAGNLSGGMKQKLSLAAGLLHRPKLLILDEPTTGVDPVSRREFWQLLYRLNRTGLTLVISTPYMDEVELCHKLAFLDQGKVKASGSPQELLANYPYKLYYISGKNLRSHLTRFRGLPVHDFYLLGENMHIVFDPQTDSHEKIKHFLVENDLTQFELSPATPSLNDLFSVLSAREEEPR